MNEVITFPVIDQETGEIIEITMDKIDYQNMLMAEEEAELKRQERILRLEAEEYDSLRYLTDD